VFRPLHQVEAPDGWEGGQVPRGLRAGRVQLCETFADGCAPSAAHKAQCCDEWQVAAEEVPATEYIYICIFTHSPKLSVDSAVDQLRRTAAWALLI